jgi:CheY-like chemotaxis protein
VTKVFRLILRPNGYRVLETRTAETAIGIAYTEHIDLLIADVAPPCSGIHVACQLKAWMPDLRIILSSGYPPVMWDEQQTAELSELPSDSVRVLRKPFFPTELLRTVEQLIGAAMRIPIAAATWV